MEWEVVEPKRGAPKGGGPAVTIACRRPRYAGSLRPDIVVFLNSELARALEWRAGAHVRMLVNRRLALMRFEPCARNRGWALHGKPKRDALELNVRLDWLPMQTHGARPAEHEISHSGLAVLLPEWAWPPERHEALAEAAAEAKEAANAER